MLTAFSTLGQISATTLPKQKSIDHGPSEAAARQNAFHIFNAVHSAMRQWGSSLNHNGMSAFLVTIPEGVLLHHGTNLPDPPAGPEWLAFEIEHAEMFANPHPPKLQKPSLALFTSLTQQYPLLQRASASQQPPNDAFPPAYGYLHTYLTTSPLPLLYLDGTSAGNTDMGTLDTQDVLLRGNRTAPLMDEYGRAQELCNLVSRRWGLSGIVRMEAGFEVIKCGPDFTRGMRLLSATRRPRAGEIGWSRDIWEAIFEFVRAIGRRYGGIGGGRVRVDWGSMVSAYFYEVDLFGASEKGLPRLVEVGDEELGGIRKRIEEVVRERKDGTKEVVNWQGLVDLIVARYAKRLRYMADKIEEIEVLQHEVNTVLNTYIDYADFDEDHHTATARCAKFYTQDVLPRTQEDRLILTAVETVTHSICSALFQVRKLVVENSEPTAGSVQAAKDILRGLMDKLKWTEWKECAGCGIDEVCFLPMWPFGDKESHERPNCRNTTSLVKGWWGEDTQYWEPPPSRRPPPLGDDDGPGEL
ncbi:hypothetical protein P885DRAFT_44303 [Corynascus similis CBS 632.67]